MLKPYKKTSTRKWNINLPILENSEMRNGMEDMGCFQVIRELVTCKSVVREGGTWEVILPVG